MSEYVLKEMVAAGEGKRIYFKMMVGIGPCGTSKLSEAQRFDTKQKAMQSPAYVHMLSCYEPVLVDVEVIREANDG